MEKLDELIIKALHQRGRYQSQNLTESQYRWMLARLELALDMEE